MGDKKAPPKKKPNQWMMGLGLVGIDGTPYAEIDKPLNCRGRTYQIRRTVKQLTSDKKELIRLLKLNTVMNDVVYEDLVARGFLKQGESGTISFRTFAGICYRLRANDLGRDMVPNTTKVHEIIKPGMSREVIARKLGLTVQQVHSAIGSLRKNKGLVY